MMKWYFDSYNAITDQDYIVLKTVICCHKVQSAESSYPDKDKNSSGNKCFIFWCLSLSIGDRNFTFKASGDFYIFFCKFPG